MKELANSYSPSEFITANIIYLLFSIFALCLFLATIYVQQKKKDSLETYKVNYVRRRKDLTELETVRFIAFLFIISLFISIIMTLIKFQFNVITIIASVLSIIIAIIINKLLFYFITDFFENKNLKEVGLYLFITPLVNILTIRVISTIPVMKESVNYFFSSLPYVTLVIVVLNLFLSIYCIFVGVRECIINPYILTKHSSDEKINFEIKMKVLITWFIIIFINTVSILYVVLRLFPGSIIDAAADNGTPNIFSLSYFAIITLLTIGYGDIVPRGIGRFAVSMTSLIGAFYMIIAVASIISVSDSNKK